MDVDEDFPWFYSVPIETLKSVGQHFKQNTLRSSYLMLYSAKLRLDFRVDI